jgi:hypothetical protein
LKGGRARADKLSSEQRVEIAKRAAASCPPLKNADKRVTAIPARARVGQHLVPAERVEDRLRFHHWSVEIVGMNVTARIRGMATLSHRHVRSVR